MRIASLFIRRPRLAFVVSAIITIAGLLALDNLPVAQFPNIVPPEVTVSTLFGLTITLAFLALALDSSLMLRCLAAT